MRGVGRVRAERARARVGGRRARGALVVAGAEAADAQRHAVPGSSSSAAPRASRFCRLELPPELGRRAGARRAGARRAGAGLPGCPSSGSTASPRP